MKNSKTKNQTSRKSTLGAGKVYNLLERLAVFGEGVINLCNNIDQSVVTKPIISQLVRSSTSIGANYAEAINGSSRKDFRNKLFIAKKEAQETQHWLRMLKSATTKNISIVVELENECRELILIIQSMANKVDQKDGD